MFPGATQFCVHKAKLHGNSFQSTYLHEDRLYRWATCVTLRGGAWMIQVLYILKRSPRLLTTFCSALGSLGESGMTWTY